jgi:hypothetical protein
MSLLNDASNGETPLRDSSTGGTYVLPQVHVRKVQLVSGASWFDTDNGVGNESKRAVAIPRIPKPTFGSSPNLAGLSVGSPKVHPATSGARTQSTPPSLPKFSAKFGSSPIEHGAVPRPTFGSFINPLEYDDESDQDGSYGYEITLATSDRRGLLKFFTNVLSNKPLQLNIKVRNYLCTNVHLDLHMLALFLIPFVLERFSDRGRLDFQLAVSVRGVELRLMQGSKIVWIFRQSSGNVLCFLLPKSADRI